MGRAEVTRSMEHAGDVMTPPGPDSEHVTGIVIGRLIGFRRAGIPLVVYPGQTGDVAIAARSVVDLRGEHIGRDIALAFEDGDPCRPIVMGCLRGDLASPLANRPPEIEVDADGQRLIISAAHEVVLRCGEASITLTREGRVDIRGTYVATQAKGVNRIKGGSVQIN